MYRRLEEETLVAVVQAAEVLAAKVLRLAASDRRMRAPRRLAASEAPLSVSARAKRARALLAQRHQLWR